MNYEALTFWGFVFIVMLVAILTVNAVFDGVFLILEDAIEQDRTGTAKSFFGSFAEGYDKVSIDLWSRE